ncbi:MULTISPECIES: ABC transporter permease [Streptomyces]|jgi:putative spermidine/putrescine transport system permease protein|uniref:Putative spermidine/putrescine transport system permease protein n=1 Tax=Streptomyces nymphaeiformis TaxID=2663842 RepID=A0A7W7XFP3_9ACTN|nr:ABC transporter permease subunit [Streptomyces nymphaeiformis]MBB4986447.1 putative spermidine/putrescine transport system permease protein [Streptomyces nymphaeiformis]
MSSATPTEGTAGGTSRRRRGPRTWLAALPLIAFTALAFGLPLGALLFGAVTRTDPATGATALTGEHLSRSLQGPYLGSLVGSVQLSALTALIGSVLGVLIAQAVVTSRSQALRSAVLTASGVLANFGGVPLAFAFIATVGISGVVTQLADLTSLGWNLYSFGGLAVVYLYFLIPLMVLVIMPALDGLRPQWREAAQNAGAGGRQYWRHVGIPVLAPSLLGGFVLLFGSAFAAHATAAALVGGSVPLVTLKIADALSGNVMVGQENVALALGLDMILIAGLVMAIYLPLQRRSARWLR